MLLSGLSDVFDTLIISSCMLTLSMDCRELDDLHSGAIRKGALPDSRPEGTASPQDGDLVSSLS